jgi:amino acid transporter
VEATSAEDEKALARFGYAQQLLRSMGAFQNFALSFSIISILTGAVTLYGHGLRFGGPLVMSVGWPVVAFFTMFIALSLAELSSAFPTAGALYHWSSLLGGPGVGFFTAWLNTLGQFAITAAIDYGLAEFLAPMLGLPAQRSHLLGLFAALLLSHGILNHLGVRAVAVLNTVSAWYHLLGVALLVGCLGWLAPMQPVNFLFTPFTHEAYPLRYAFLVALLQAGWTFTGYDASAHASEETEDPSRNTPKGIVLSVAVSAVAGWVMLAAVTLAVPNLQVAASIENPFLWVLRTSMPQVGSALAWMVIGAMWFCGLASVTSNSRMLFAFARDGGLPFSAQLAKVSARWKSPHVAVWTSVAMALLVALWADAYSAMAALSVVALYLSYALPIGAGLIARLRGKWKERGPWNLGRWSTLVNLVALLWVAVMTVLMSMPPNQLAGYTLAATLLVLVAVWYLAMRSWFTGPKITPRSE